MKPITTGSYQNSNGFKGWIETVNWIVFEKDNGDLIVFNGRNLKTGAVMSDGIVIPHSLH